MWFVVPDPGLTDQSSWEARLGALGRCAEDGGTQDGDSCWSNAGTSSVVGRGAPDRRAAPVLEPENGD